MTIHERKQAVSGQMELFERSFTTEEQEMTKVWRKNEWEESFKTKGGKIIDFRPPNVLKDHKFKLFVRKLYDANSAERREHGQRAYKNLFRYFRKNYSFVYEKYAEQERLNEKT